MKYVIFKANKGNLIYPMIFPDCIAHSQVKIEGAVPVSAGFITFDVFGNFAVHGNSVSLKLSPNFKNDDKYLNLFVKSITLGMDYGTNYYMEDEEYAYDLPKISQKKTAKYSKWKEQTEAERKFDRDNGLSCGMK